MRTHHHEITTDDPMVQRYFNQGLTLAYGFNNQESERSFREAIRLDPNCAMCRWGFAWVLGPNLNMGVDPSHKEEALATAKQALALADHATAKEGALIRAIQARHSAKPPEDRGGALDLAYAEAILHLDTAIRLQDALTYDEPPPWYFPICQSLEAVLLEAGRPKEAEQVFAEELAYSPENGMVTSRALPEPRGSGSGTG
jgi:tetratricopeptide (TPR) repeat protein